MKFEQAGRFGTMEIVNANVRDAESIQHILCRVWLATYPSSVHGITTEDIRHHFSTIGSPERKARLMARLAEPEFREQLFVAKDGGVLVGVCRVIARSKGVGLNRIHSMYILPEYHGRGIGTALWEAGQTILDRATATFLYVAEYTTKAICFYEHLGFVETGEHEPSRFHFPSGAFIPRIEMVRRPG